jgi:hypothetical protein
MGPSTDIAVINHQDFHRVLVQDVDTCAVWVTHMMGSALLGAPSLGSEDVIFMNPHFPEEIRARTGGAVASWHLGLHIDHLFQSNHYVISTRYLLT